MIVLPALFAILSGVFAALCVSRAIHLPLVVDILAGIASFALMLAATQICAEDWPYIGLFVGYGLTAWAAKVGHFQRVPARAWSD